MDKRNTIFLGFAVIAIGLFIIPNTMSMFVGQHNWFSVKNPSDMEDLCKKCHKPEVDEWQETIANGGAHATFDKNFPGSGCTVCHQVNVTFLRTYSLNVSSLENYSFEDFTIRGLTKNSTPEDFQGKWRNQSTPHAAIKVKCVDCHYNATIQLSNSTEAHRDFYTHSSTNATENAACIGCHTMTNINISWYKFGGLNINATINRTSNRWDINVSTNTTLVQTS
jgi:hypothetical protein